MNGGIVPYVHFYIGSTMFRMAQFASKNIECTQHNEASDKKIHVVGRDKATCSDERSDSFNHVQSN